jgi:phosphate transport system ATP-binding protein
MSSEMRQPSIDIEVAGVSVAYAGRTVLRDVNMTLGGGRITAIIGPSGCGKSSFLAAINRLTDLTPGCDVSGSITIDGVDVRDWPDITLLRRKVAMIFQRPNPFPLSVKRNLELPLLDLGCADVGEREGRIEKALREVGLWNEVADRLASPARELSGGQQQRLCMARALILEPHVLLFDEPCSALDPIAGGVIEELISGFAGCCTVVIVTHNLAQARRIADDAAFFWYDDAGYLEETGPAEQLFTAPGSQLTRDYLDGAAG